MTTTNSAILCPTIGQAWAAAVGYFEDWVTDDTKVMTASLQAIQNCKTIRMQYVQGADTTQVDLLCADIYSGATFVPLGHVLESPGWRRMPKLLMSTYGANDTAALFVSVLRAVRSSVYDSWCGQGAPTWDHYDIIPNMTGLLYHTYTALLYVINYLGRDLICLATNDGTMPASFLNGNQPTDGLDAGPQSPSSGGGGGGITQAQVDEIVAAVNNVALQAYDLSLNNGATIFSVRGNIRTG